MTGSSDMPAVGDTIDDFLLIEELGKGAFATVFLARQRSLHRTVALKVSEDIGVEGQTLAQLDHPHIVRVFDQRPLPDQGLRLLYMEYVSAGTLERVVDRVKSTAPWERTGKLLLDVIDEMLSERGELPPSDSLLRREISESSWPDTVALLGAHLAEALDHAHGQKVLHRDIKAANVLLASNGRAKLADFNISYHENAGIEAGEYMGGSPAYMAPEQVQACSPFEERTPESLDERVDQFSLGALLWELLTGELPYDTPELEDSGGWKELFEDLVKARREDVPTKSSENGLPPDTPKMLRAVLLRSIAFRAQDRYPNARALAYDLRVCRRPDARLLLNPVQSPRILAARRFPTIACLLATIVPNAALSVLNVLYNAGRVVTRETWQMFQSQVAVINLVAFTIGLTLLVRWARPMIRALRKRKEGEAQQPHHVGAAIEAGLALGHRMTPVVLALWAVAGLAFPIWEHLDTGTGRAASYFHFIVSNLFFGALAANLTFFLLSWLALRVHVPHLLGPDVPRDKIRAALARLEKRAATHFTISMCVPFACIIVLAFVPVASRTAFLALGLMGIASFGAAFACFQQLRRMVAALREL